MIGNGCSDASGQGSDRERRREPAAIGPSVVTLAAGGLSVAAPRTGNRHISTSFATSIPAGS